MPKLPKFPPEFFPLSQETYRWKQVLTDEEKQFLSGFWDVAQVLKTGGSDSELGSAIESEFRDFEHNGNRPWDPDFTQICGRLNDILEKIGYYLVIDYEVRKLEH